MGFRTVLSLCLAGFFAEFTQCGDFLMKLEDACANNEMNELVDGLHYVSFQTPLLETFSPKRNEMQSKTMLQVRKNYFLIDQFTYKSEMIQFIDHNTATTAYLLFVNCVNGDMFIDPNDYKMLFDDTMGPAQGFRITDMNPPSSEGGEDEDASDVSGASDDASDGDVDGESDGSNPFDASKKGSSSKWTAKYIVWLVLIIIVGLFALGIFVLLYWWCCHARTYRLVETSSFPNAAYTQLPNNGVYGAIEDGTAGSTMATPIDDTMVSQTVTVEADILP